MKKEGTHFEAVADILNKRVSMRRFKEQPLREEDVQWVIEGARRAPTAGNMMLYSILLVTDPAKKLILSESCDHQPFIAKAPLVMVFVADYQRWFDYYEASGVKDYCQKTGKRFKGPDEGDLFLACSDALIAAQNSVIAAEARGIASCYIGDIMENYERHRELLNLPPWAFPIAMLCLGYYPEGERPSPRSRFESKYIVFKEAYKKLSPDELKAMFQEEEKSFSQNNPFKAENLGQWMYARKTGSDFAEEMARSVRKALKNWQGESIL
ncbi:nitroreductase family protein [Desulfitobacterium sp.]|uniref:nitroreductase family protein n=1 Tax=Desulfitobacterium sp. TaxID=49981 RepID=UPI002B9D6AF5|nr:nitroreductase family protein [Desulfitobacterium sp.]HVJ49913.1 nitroreductase family protein [Desulfitobacterium sp.]